ncbi:MAG TPA: methyltransferase domain-containing protein [Pyrinomonadaceae bacterium]|nr:methyltransferase domain-containing protein [Pyrinomonadaceae bacterium]
MAEAISDVRADFDRIALLSGEEWGHNGLYHDFLARHVPVRCRAALDIGCGAGDFSRLLAGVSGRVLALDLSPNMIGLARERSAQFPNITFEVADVLTRELPAETFDCIATVATLHHLPVGEVLPKLKRALRPGGVLLVLDLFQAEGLSDAVLNALAVPVSVGLRLFRSGRLLPPREVRRAWDEHGRHDRYLTLAQVREVCAETLHGALVTRHLLWRYSVVWRKAA